MRADIGSPVRRLLEADTHCFVIYIALLLAVVGSCVRFFLEKMKLFFPYVPLFCFPLVG